MSQESETTARPGAATGDGWRDLFGPAARGPMAVLGGGVALYAINVYLTTSLLPSAVAEIGGMELYAWAMTVFLIASVITSMLVSRILSGHGPRRSYWIALGLFGAGSLVAAVAPTMPVLLVGRGLQGLGGGLLAGLAFAVIRTVLPERLWRRAFGLLSAMWGVGNLVGPVLGGLFAQFGAWRGAFVLLVISTLGIALLVRRAMPDQHPAGQASAPAAVPVLSLVLLTLATTAVSVASINEQPVIRIALIAVAVILVAGFVIAERAGSVQVLPARTFRRGSVLIWFYLSIAALAIGSTIETFLPLFGQRIGGLSPLGAGLLGASLSWGWSLASILSSGVSRPAATRVVRLVGPALVAIGLAGYTALQLTDPGPVLIGLWFVALIVAGTGIGMSFVQWMPAVMASSTDPAEAQQAAAGVNTVQLISNAFGSALAGLLVGLGGPGIIGSAQVLGYGYAVVGVLALVVAARALRIRTSGK
ncbi:MFS transporter [Microlunatus parietis]|uniref:MFS family permease n=1 Tax=Microlunatus parietis TaxID=682979 RepID=A0A7Y9LD11_9ACTN|nr:MFS transporter [Microlunatus parietis]NYE72418.1 MFS family permease [Microlunatus parietis]